MYNSQGNSQGNTLLDIAAMDKKYGFNLFARAPLCFERGDGAILYDIDGRRYLDFLGGIAVNALGHAHPTVVAAISAQAERIIHCTNLYYIEGQAIAAKALVEASCADRVFFCNSGAEANEAAIKLAKIYHYKAGRPEKTQFVTLCDSFHGRTLATLAATGQPKYHKPFEPILPWFSHVPMNDIAALRAAVSREATAAVMLEAVQGESGVHVADRAFVEAAAQVCRDAGALLVFDEIQTGLGRTGKLFAYEHYGVEPDIFTLAKALGSGFPVGAMLAKDGVASAFEPGDHGSTFAGSPLACAAVNATLSEIICRRLPDYAAEQGERLIGLLRELKPKRLKVREVRGLGLMAAVELEEPAAVEVKNKLMDAGLLVGSVGASVIRLLPPLIVTNAQIEEAVDSIEAALY